MQHDEMIWATLNQHFCSFKVTTDRATFCRQKYNVSGMCNRSSCPLANSRYGTILERGGTLVLHIKTIERAHSPKNLWQKVKLSKNYAKALAQIDAAMAHWPPFLIHKAKQRLTKMTQFLLRKRKLLAGAARTFAVPIKQKTERRDAARERKAAKAAKLDNAIEAELLNRLKSGAYGDIYNFPRKQYERALGAEGVADGEEEAEDESGDETEESEEEADGNEFEADLDSSEEEESEEEELEYEEEEEEESEGDEDGGSDGGGGRPAPAAVGAARARPERSRPAADGGDDTDASGSGSGSSGSGSGSDDSDSSGGEGAARAGRGGRGAAAAAGRTAVADLEDPPAGSADVFAFDDGSDIEAAVAAAGGDERAALRSRSRKRLAAAAPGAVPATGRGGGAAAAAAGAATAAGTASPPAARQRESKRVRFSAADGGGDGGGGGAGGGAPATAPAAAAAAPRRSTRRSTPRRARPPRPAASDAGVRVEVEVETERGETVWEAAGV